MIEVRNLTKRYGMTLVVSPAAGDAAVVGLPPLRSGRWTDASVAGRSGWPRRSWSAWRSPASEWWRLATRPMASRCRHPASPSQPSSA